MNSLLQGGSDGTRKSAFSIGLRVAHNPTVSPEGISAEIFPGPAALALLVMSSEAALWSMRS
jgi:hypothetical protein